MNEKEAFEDIIASKFSEAEFPFDEGNWDHAEDMISSYRTKQKRRRTGFVFFSGIALGVLVMLPFVNRINNNTDNVIAEAVKPGAENANSDILNTIGSQNSEQNDVPAENTESATPALSPLNTIHEQESVNGPAETSDVQPLAHNFGKAVKQRMHKGKHNGTNTSTAAHSAIAPNNQLDSIVPDKNNMSMLTRLESMANLTKDSIETVVLLDAPEKPMAPPVSMLPWNFSAVAGGNCVNGFSCNPIQGIEISKAIRPYLELGTGAYYTYLSINSGAVKTITTHTEYGFGYKADVTEIKTNRLHYVVIPVYAKVNVDDKNSFIIGANAFALLTASNSVTSYRESYGQKQETVSKKTTGYSNGINSYDIGLLVGYKRHLFWNIGASIYFNYGFMDIKKNEYYNSSKFERNMSTQFMLTYKL